MMAPVLFALLLTPVQVPNAAAAISAARGARADVEAAQRKNADALNPPAVPPQQPQAHPAAPATPAGASAAPKPPAPSAAQQAADGVYTYDGQGRRDQFVSLLNRGDVSRNRCGRLGEGDAEFGEAVGNAHGFVPCNVSSSQGKASLQLSIRACA